MTKELLGFALAMATASAVIAAPSESGRVRDIVSPDAIRMTLRGRIETIQLIGVDASDYDRPGRDVEAQREKAIEFGAGLALGQTVRLEKDPRLPDRNPDNRLQRYVFLDTGVLLNSEMVTAGWARAVEKPPFSRQDDFRKLEAEARTSGRGIWKGAAPAAPGTATAQPAKPLKATTPPVKPQSAAPPLATPPPRGTPAARGTPPQPAPTAVARATPPAPVPAADLTRPLPTPRPGAGPLDKDEITAFLTDWQARWTAKELEPYLSLYSTRFQGSGVNYAGWRARKRRVFPRAGTIELGVSEVEMSGDANQATVRFRQSYKSATLSDVGIKVIVLVRQSDGWKILREDWAPK